MSAIESQVTIASEPGTLDGSTSSSPSTTARVLRSRTFIPMSAGPVPSAFHQAAVAYYPKLGVTIQRVITDKARRSTLPPSHRRASSWARCGSSRLRIDRKPTARPNASSSQPGVSGPTGARSSRSTSWTARARSMRSATWPSRCSATATPSVCRPAAGRILATRKSKGDNVRAISRRQPPSTVRAKCRTVPFTESATVPGAATSDRPR